MDKLFGLPAHPFLVHIPIVLLPLAGIGTVAIAVRRSWYYTYRWIVLALAVIGTAGAVLAASAGEELAGRIVAVLGDQAARSWQDHADLGETARNVALAYLILLAAFVLVPWLMHRRSPVIGEDRPPEASATSTASTTSATSKTAARSTGPRWLRPLLAGLAVVGAAGSVVTVIQAGHTGSRSVWQAYVDGSGHG